MAGARKIIADGKDITAEVNKRFIALELVDEAGQASDGFTLVLADNGEIAFPARESEIQLWMGPDENKLVYRGFFTVDDVELGFTPFTLTISASAARMRGSFTAAKDDSWHNITVTKLVEVMANRNGLQAAVAEQYASVMLAHRDQIAQSDSDFLTRLADELDATMKVTRGKLIFFAKGDGANVSGKRLPAVLVRLNSMTQGKLLLAGRVRYAAVRAQYRDIDSAETMSVMAGSGTPERLLPGVYDTKTQAESAAAGALHGANRKAFVFNMTRMPANPEIMAERLVTIAGHPREQANGEWVVEQYSETQDAKGYWCKWQAVKPRYKPEAIPNLASPESIIN